MSCLNMSAILVCLEALAMRLPVITTPINGVREVMGQRGGIVGVEAGRNPDEFRLESLGRRHDTVS